ncbi:MAG: cysteine synthase A [Afipia sp. 62-7]|nr:MAG: cysteine synthase A [Afipia sp. 62-7]
MHIRNDVIEAIGNPPLIKLKHASDITGCTILGKAEFMNPGQSVKDRAGKQMILEAEERGELKPGGLVVESTAGNTGIGLAVVAAARGYRTIIVIPETQSQEKKDVLRLLGAELVEVPALPVSNPNNYQHVGRRLADELRKTEKNGVLFADQWNNLDNRKAHYVSTGPEIWDQTNGKVDGFICSIGSGGTLAGTSIYLRERNKNIKIGVADPRGAAMYNYFDHGEVKSTEGGSVTEGIGLGRITPIVQDLHVDKAYLIEDSEAVPIVFDLLEHEGLCVGGSSGINIAGAIRLAKDLGPGHTVVTILADYGTRYQSKLFNPDFLRSKNLPVPEWLERKNTIKPPFEKV